MKPAPFAYHRPDTLKEALELLARYGGDAKPLAGGQSLIPAMNFRLARPVVLVDLNRVAGLAGIAPGAGGGLTLGAMTRHRAVERSEVVRAGCPLLAEAVPWIAHPPIRNRGTVGGSVAHADPAAELPAVLVALEATLVLQGRSGTRRMSAGEFSTGLFGTALDAGAGELLVAIELPPTPARTGTAFTEVARRHGDFALAGVAVTVSLDDRGACAAARITLLGVGDGPVLAPSPAAALAGRRPEPKVLEEAAAAVAADLDPPGDIHASADYRRHLAVVLTRRALRRAVERAGSEAGPP